MERQRPPKAGTAPALPRPVAKLRPAHTFPAEVLTEAERRRRAAEWIDASVLDLQRATELLAGVAEGGAAEAVTSLREITTRAKTLADRLRPPDSPPPAAALPNA